MKKEYPVSKTWKETQKSETRSFTIMIHRYCNYCRRLSTYLKLSWFLTVKNWLMFPLKQMQNHPSSFVNLKRVFLKEKKYVIKRGNTTQESSGLRRVRVCLKKKIEVHFFAKFSSTYILYFINFPLLLEVFFFKKICGSPIYIFY